jgi:hypothetical protein
MPLRDIFFNLIPNITSFPICIPRIAAVDDIESAQNITDISILKSCFIQQV